MAASVRGMSAEQLSMWDQRWLAWGELQNSKPAGHVRVTGIRLRDAGQKSVVSHTPPDFKEKFQQVVEQMPKGHTFTVEDVREKLNEIPSNVSNNYFGAAMNGLARRKLIKSTGRIVQAERPTRHAAWIREWERL